MARQYASIEPPLRRFIEAQHLFFVASATADSRINLSPKGLDGLRVLDEGRVAYLDLTGSGNETSAHLLADGRLTIMVCGFAEQMMILRLYGRGKVHLRGTPGYAAILDAHFGGRETAGARQIVEMAVEMVQTSCGYGVPRFTYEGERDTLVDWADRKGPEGLAAYWDEKNRASIDGLPTGIAPEAMLRGLS